MHNKIAGCGRAMAQSKEPSHVEFVINTSTSALWALLASRHDGTGIRSNINLCYKHLKGALN